MSEKVPILSIDEFSIILIGALIFFVGIAAINYYVFTSQQPNISIQKNQTILLSNYFLLDGLLKQNVIFSEEDKIYRNLFEEKTFVAKLQFSKEEINNIDSLKIEFKSERGISKLYLLEGKNLIKAKETYTQSEIKQQMIFVAKIEEYDTTIHYIILAILLGSIAVLAMLYRELIYQREKIKIIAAAIIIALSIVFISLALIKVYDNVSLTIYSIKERAEKEFTIPYVSNITKMEISFDIGANSLRTENLKIYLNDELIYDAKPTTYSVRVIKYNPQLKNVNTLRFETYNAKYEIKNLYILFT
ncbi:MAG: hypothetical protein QW409_01365 [Candidatus Aenigmatarchaeota archaeon]